MVKKTDKLALSIIIPTFNEADFVGYLLYSLCRQTVKNFEVIVSDGDSEDETLKVVRSFSPQLPKLTIVITKERRCPVVQRNMGAKKAGGGELLFLDADTILPCNFLEKSLEEIQKRDLDCAHVVTYPLTKRIFDQYVYMILYWGIKFLADIYPLPGGYAIFIKKELHRKIGGFDERLTKIADDIDYGQRAARAGGKFGVITSSFMYMSVRRLDKEGRTAMITRPLFQSILFTIFGKYKAQEYINRSFGDFGTFRRILSKERQANRFLSKLSREQFNKFVGQLRGLLGELRNSL